MTPGLDNNTPGVQDGWRWRLDEEDGPLLDQRAIGKDDWLLTDTNVYPDQLIAERPVSLEVMKKNVLTL